MGPIKKVIIPVAGLGTRGLPFTKEIPKELTPILDTPTIHFIVEEALASGIEQVILVTAKGKHSIEDYFSPSPALEQWLIKRGKEEWAQKIRHIGSLCELITVRQKEPLGLGHAILCAKGVISNENFAVCLGDEIFPSWDGMKPALQKLIESAEAVSASCVGVVEIPKNDSLLYGIVDLHGTLMDGGPKCVYRTVEKPKPSEAPSTYAIIGRYVFGEELFDALKDQKPGVGGEIQLTDGMNRLAKERKLYAELVPNRRYDIGNPFFYVKAQLDAALMKPELKDRIYQYIKSL